MGRTILSIDAEQRNRPLPEMDKGQKDYLRMNFSPQEVERRKREAINEAIERRKFFRSNWPASAFKLLSGV